MSGTDSCTMRTLVTPVRERGLKCLQLQHGSGAVGHSREGAWIEIDLHVKFTVKKSRHSREGAWIEICASQDSTRASMVTPVRERGLKCRMYEDVCKRTKSLP